MIKLGKGKSKIDVIDISGKRQTIEVDTHELLKAMSENAICHICNRSAEECKCEDNTWIW